MASQSETYDVEVIDRDTGKTSRVRVDASSQEEAQRLASTRTGYLAGEARKVKRDLAQPPHANHSRRLTLPLALSMLAIAIASGSLIYTVLRDPLGKGVSGYDLSTPEASAKASLQMEANSDIRAQLEIGRLKGVDLDDAVRTLEINRTADFGDKKLVFVSFLDRGRKTKRVMAFEKDLESKLWLPTYVASYSVRSVDEQLAKDMEAWEDKKEGGD